MKFGIGQAVKRVEDQALVTGQGQYTDDINVDGQAYAYILRSPHANAKILSIDTEDAKASSGVLEVLTGADVAADGLGDMPCNIPLKNKDDTPRHDTPHPILAKDQVRFVGDPVAVVVAETYAEARDAAELIAVDFEELDHAVDTEAAAQHGAAPVWEHIPNNIAFDWANGDQTGVEKALKEAAHTVKLRIVNNRVVVNSMEARTALADYDAETDRSTLYTSTQGPHVIYGQIADVVLKIGKEKLRIITKNVGGGFGMKVFLHPEQPLIVWASRKIKRAVKWTSDRSEAFMSDIQGRDNVSYAEMALDKNGVITGLRVKTYANMGAYLSNYAPFVATGGTAMLVGLYKTPALHINVLGVVTNTMMVDAYRGAGRPEAAYLIERLIDAAARQVGLGVDEIRRRNFIPPEAMPYTTPLGDVYDSGEFEAIMDKAMAQADWAGFEARREEAAKRGKLRGIGLATYIERCGGGAPETSIAKFNDDDTVTLLMGTQDNGQGHHTSYMQIASQALGIDADAIRIEQGDTDQTPVGMTGGSRSVPVGGAAVLGVADKIKEKGKEVAAHVMEVAPVDIEFADGAFTVAGTDKTMSLFQVARAAREGNVPPGFEGTLDDEYQRVPEAATFPNGAHIIEVEIDPDTGTLVIPRYTVVDDFGDVINPLLLEGQVHGGIVQGLGQALHEYTVYDEESGQLVTGSLMDYNLPKADTVPFFSFDTHNVRCTTNPLGIKGSGEAGAIGAPPAVINAIVDALMPVYGITHVDMPATPLAVWTAIQEAQAKQAAE